MPSRFNKLFATTVSEGKLSTPSGFLSQIVEQTKSIQKLDKMGREWSKENYRGGYTSYASLSDLQHRYPVFMELSKKLQAPVEAFAQAQDWDMRGFELVMNSCWVNVMPTGTSHTLHHHPHSVVSGAYYVDVPPGSVALRIEDPRMGFYMHAPLTKKPSLYHEVRPSVGKFVLFESWLRHEVPANQSKKPRISVSFNYSLEAK